MERWMQANTCMFGCNCKSGLNCPYLHPPEERQIFKDEWGLRARKRMMRCGFCVRVGGSVILETDVLLRDATVAGDSGYESAGVIRWRHQTEEIRVVRLKLKSGSVNSKLILNLWKETPSATSCFDRGAQLSKPNQAYL